MNCYFVSMASNENSGKSDQTSPELLGFQFNKACVIHLMPACILRMLGKKGYFVNALQKPPNIFHPKPSYQWSASKSRKVKYFRLIENI